MNGLDAFNDFKVKLKKWTDQCPSKRHSTLHPNTHIMGEGTPDLLDDQFVLFKQYWEVHKGTLGNYVLWETESSGAYGNTKAGKVWDFCVRCDTCNKATGYGGQLKAPTFVYHVNAVPAQKAVTANALVLVKVVESAPPEQGPTQPSGPLVSAQDSVSK